MDALYAGIDKTNAREILEAKRGRVGELMASLRGDMAGTSPHLLAYSTTYHERVSKMWEYYAVDPLFKRMVDRAVDFVANGSQWEVTTPADDVSWVTKLVDWAKNRKEQQAQDEELFWNVWSLKINGNVDNMIPGLDEITRWAAKHILLSGMFVPHWKLGEVPVGKRTFIAPVEMTCYPASRALLIRNTTEWVKEKVWVKKVLPSPNGMYDGQPDRTYPNSVPLPDAFIDIAAMGTSTEIGHTEGAAIKYNWTPGDLTTTRSTVGGGAGNGVYPPVPFHSLVPWLAMRQKLCAADLAILDGIINYLMVWKIGDKDHPPEPPARDNNNNITRDGTIGMVRKLLQEGRVGPALELFVPYYVNLEIKMPDSAVLMKEEKYNQSAIEIFQSFGIFFSKTASGSRERMERINLSQFEEFLNGIRATISGFYQRLARHIIELNSKSLKHEPIWMPNPLNTKSEVFMNHLHALAKIGRISPTSLLRYHGLNEAVELRRIAHTLGTDADDVYNDNVPTSYVQKANVPGGKGGDQSVTRQTPTTQRGRPSDKPEDVSAPRKRGRPRKNPE
jgi:hypothetical protein